jgi:hypothetical protein
VSPTQRSLAKLRKEGWTACVVEQHIRPPNTKGKKPEADFGFKRDAFGFGDILACNSFILSDEDGVQVLRLNSIALVQTTTGANLAARITKILAEPRAKVWLVAGGRIIVHGWRKLGKAGKRKLWQCDEREITLDQFAAQETAA